MPNLPYKPRQLRPHRPDESILIDLMLAVNDPRTGQPDGECGAMAVYVTGNSADALAEIECDGCGMTFVERPGNRFLLAARQFAYTAGKHHVGNWCWNNYRVTLPTAAAILQLARERGSQMTVAAEDLFDAWGKGGDLLVALRAEAEVERE